MSFDISRGLTVLLTLFLSTIGGQLMAQTPDDTILYAPDIYSKSGKLIQINNGPVPGGDDATLKLLIVHTSRFVSALTSQDPDLVAFMQRSVAEVNQFFANTGLATRIELSGIIEWDRPAGSDLKSDLDALPNFVENETRLRDETGADLVQLWELPEVGIDAPNLCGWGQIVGPNLIVSTAGYGYSAVIRGIRGTVYENCFSATTPEVFASLVAHELGHNLGSSHDWDDADGVGAFEFSRGILCGDSQYGEQPGTIMSNTGIRQPFFSNPDIYRNGDRCGTPEGSPYPADNRETFTRTASYLAELRQEPAAKGSVSLSAPSTIAEFSEWLPLTLTRTDSSQSAAVELLTYTYGSQRNVDFEMPYRTRIAFAPGQSSVIVPVLLYGDMTREGNEALRFWLQRGENVAISPSRSKLVTIRDNAWPSSSETLPPLTDLSGLAVSEVTVASDTASVATSGSGGGGGALSWWLLAIGVLFKSVHRPGLFATV